MRSPPQATGLSLHPFRATRYATDDLAAVTSPPYDVVEPAGFADLEMHPHNVVRLILPREGGDCDRYQQAARVWDEWLASGVLATDADDALWVYEQSGPGGDLVGIVGTIPIDQPRAVLPHEDVMPGPVVDRAELMAAVGANLEPILLVHDPNPGETTSEVSATTAIVDSTRERDFDVCMVGQGDVVHRLWRISDRATIQTINDDLAERSVLIADGHHRFAAYRLIHQRAASTPDSASTTRGLALIVDGRQHPLTLGAIHRSLPNVSLDQAVKALDALDGHVDIHWLPNDKAIGPDGAPAVGTQPVPAQSIRLTDGQRSVDVVIPEPNTLVPAADRSILWRTLPTALLHEYLIPQVWDVDDAQVWYHHDTRGVQAATEKGRLGVLLPPLELPTVIELARRGELLPRKSTSFGPKPRTGLLMRQFATQRATPA